MMDTIVKLARRQSWALLAQVRIGGLRTGSASDGAVASGLGDAAGQHYTLLGANCRSSERNISGG